MKPRKIDILGHTWKIRYIKVVKDKGELLDGFELPDKQTILIRNTIPEDQQMSALLHEVMHIIADSLGIKLSCDEDDTARYETGLYQVLHTNKLRF